MDSEESKTEWIEKKTDRFEIKAPDHAKVKVK